MEDLDRIQAMITDDCDTWDLSPKDKDALCHALEVIASMANDLAELTDLSAKEVIEYHSNAVRGGARPPVAPLDT